MNTAKIITMKSIAIQAIKIFLICVLLLSAFYLYCLFFQFEVSDISNKINKMIENEELKIEDLNYFSHTKEICLIANDMELRYKVNSNMNCIVGEDSIVFLLDDGSCHVESLLGLNPKVLGGSVEERCFPYSSRIKLNIGMYHDQRYLYITEE